MQAINPRWAEYPVSEHSVHALAPCAAVYLPRSHGVQLPAVVAPDSAENLPATHDTHVAAVLAAMDSENLPELHAWHAVDPEATSYVPAGHAVHAGEAAAFENVPMAQDVHFVAATGEYFPDTQNRQAFEPKTSL